MSRSLNRAARLFGVLVPATFALCSAAGQVAEPVWPTSGGAPAADQPQNVVPDEAIPAPAHPPINQIEPMPMPSAKGPFSPDAPKSVLVHNSTTGQTIELPVANGSRMEGAEGGDTFIGADGAVEPEGYGRSFVNMSIWNSLTTWPGRGNVKLVMEFTDLGGNLRYFVCSGSMQDPGVVLTAAHCVYARDVTGTDIFNWADRIWVYPAWDGDGDTSVPASDAVFENYGMAVGYTYLAGSDYVNNGNWDRDCGLIRLNRTSSRQPGFLTGWFGWAWGGSCNTSRTYHNYSYPSEDCSATLHNGRDMYYWYGTIDSCPGNQLHLDTSGGCFGAVWGGMSGSGMYYRDADDNRFVHAVCSTSNRSTSGNYCKLWEQFVLDMQTYEDDTRGNTFDLQALQYRTNGSDSVVAGQQLSAGAVQISNVSNVNPAADNYTLRVYLSSNNNISSGDVLLATWNYNDVNFGAVDNIQFNIPAMTIPVGTAAGTYYVGVILDPTTDSNDFNDDTNTWDTQQITVSACQLPGTPTGVAASDGNCTNVTVSWNASTAATSYVIYRNTSNSSTGRVQIGTDNASPFTDATAVGGQLYYYWVRGRNACGDSNYSVSNSGYERAALINNSCASATNLGSNVGSLAGNLTCATNDGPSSCGLATSNPDVWYRFTAPGNGTFNVSTCGTHDDPGIDQGMDTVLGLFTSCYAQVACNDDAANPCGNDEGLIRDSFLSRHMTTGQVIRVRVSHYNTAIDDGNFLLNWNFVPDPCPADYDGDGFITGLDYDLFVQDFEAGNLDADFDGDGFLTGLDFDLYVQAYEAGC